MRWEYKVVRLPNQRFDEANNLATLNDLGQDEWEIFHIDSFQTVVVFWLRRDPRPVIINNPKVPSRREQELLDEINRLNQELLQSRRVNERLIEERNANGQNDD